MQVQGSGEKEKRVNAYRATLVVRIKDDKLYLYDILDIKKKRVRRMSPIDCTVKKTLPFEQIIYDK